ncbi:WD40/YVTN/BNR-like repeat-containing protein [Pseudomonas sp.]|uniref:WD40/YVTN/BNR-like repeat-containing protein n=1 Tax=Pseudomonas sp. TaxID=306 RepID=UPI003D13E1DB
MSEPVLRRTLSGRAVVATHLGASRFHSSLASVLSLCGVVSLLLLATAPLAVQAATDTQTRYSIESAKAVSTLLLDITQAGERLVAVGDRGHILYSDDAGRSWTQAKVPTRQLLTAIDFADAKHGWAVGHDALVLATTDGGESWTVQYEEREREAPLLDVWFENERHGIAVGAYGALIETTDGGQNWDDISDRLDNEDGFHLNAITHIEGSGLFIVGEMGGMFRSADLGQTWETVESPYQGSFFGVVGGSEPGVVIAFGLRGHLFRSDDFGDSWSPIGLSNGNGYALESGLADGGLLSDGRIVVVGHGGVVLSSSDQGRTFKVYGRPDRRSLSGVTADSEGNLILVGQGGVRIASPSGADLAPEQ